MKGSAGEARPPEPPDESAPLVVPVEEPEETEQWPREAVGVDVRGEPGGERLVRPHGGGGGTGAALRCGPAARVRGRRGDVQLLHPRGLLPGLRADRGPVARAVLAEERRDLRRVVVQARSYLGNNRDRMDDTRYRRSGLPATSLVESLVGEVNASEERVWAAVLSEDDRLPRFFTERPGCPCRKRGVIGRKSEGPGANRGATSLVTSLLITARHLFTVT